MQTSRVAVRPIDTLLRESSVQHSQLARDDRRPPASVDDVNAISSLERLNDLRAELRQHKRAHIALFGDDGNGDLEAVLQSERALASDGDQLAGELTEHFQRLDQLVSPASSSSLALSSNRTHQHHGHSGRELMRAQTIISRLTGTSGDAHHHHSHNHHHGHHSHHRPSRAASEGSLPVSLSNALDTVAIDGRGLHNTMPIPSDQAQFLSQSVQRAIADGPAQSSTYPLSYMDNDTASITSVNTTASEVGNGWMKLDTVTSTTSTTSTDTDDDLFAWSQLSKVMESAYDLSTLSQVGHPSSISARGITAVGTTLGYVLIYDEKHSLRALLGQDKISDSDPDDFDDNSGRASKTVDERHQQPQSDSFGATVCIAIAADRSTIAVGYSCGTCAVWDWKKNAHIATITPVTLRDVQSGSRLGHIRGNAVNHVAFLGASSSKIVTSDITGQVFLHELSRRIVPNRSVSTETRRVAGRYPPEALGFDAPQSHSGAAADNSRRLLDISVLPLGAQAHPADKMDLVAVLTPSALTVVSVAKTVRELLRFPSPSRFVPQHGSVVWHPTSAFTSAVGQRYSTQPLLAYSLDTTITVATLMRNGATDSPSPSLECRAIAEWTSPSSIAMLYWLSASVLLAIDTTGALWTLELPSDALSIIATRQSSNPVASSPLPSALAAVARSGNVFTDSPTSSPRGSIDLMRIGVSPSSQGTSDEYGDSDNVLPSLRPTRIRHSIGFHPMSLDDSSFSIYRGRVFALGSDRITCGTLSTWTSRLISLVGRGELLAALTYARELYLGCTNQITIGLPSEDELVADTATTTTIVERRHEAVGPVLMALVRSTLTYISGLAGTREEDETSVFGYEDMVDLATQLVEACLALQPSNESLFECMAAGSDVQHRPLSTSCLYVPDDLLSDICDAFSSTGSDSIEAALMDAVEIFVADGRLGHRLPPEVAHSLIGHLARGLDGDVQVAHRLESCIVHIHPMALDVDQVATIARRKSQQPMWDAFLMSGVVVSMTSSLLFAT
ncbi:hypothetical protein GQ42DRAFT_34711 [Ramicandelaber brevisporus]|nr:hypothetical protein GQ42DRAFT_34711 [Ramicandelaber brevisporus]